MSDGVEVGPDLWFRMVPVDDLREQDVNAHVMAPRTFERLVANIKKRGAPESAAYCAQPGGEGQVEIVSGHHRVRATRAAGFDQMPCLVDVSRMSRSEIVAKQLAHNFLIGADDTDVLKQLMSFIDTPEDLLTTGAPDDLLPGPEHEAVNLFAPRVDFDWRTVSFTVLPHQQGELEGLCDHLKDRHDLVLTAKDTEQFDEFLRIAARYARIRDIRSGGTVIAALVEQALLTIDEHVAAEEDLSAGEWVAHERVLGARGLPATAADVIKQAIEKAKREGTVSEKNGWQLLEYLAADYLAGADSPDQ